MLINKVKEIRIKKGITQEKLSRIVDCSLRNIQKIETGKSAPNIELALKIKYALGAEHLEDIFDIHK